MPTLFRIATGTVVSEIIDGEAVIMNMRTGHYFSTRAAGATLWEMMLRGIDLDSAARLLAQASGQLPEDVAKSIDVFTKDAADHQLGERVEVEQVAERVEALSAFRWSPPQLEVFTDMEDLLLLDPIHDVSEEVGWPMQKPAAPIE